MGNAIITKNKLDFLVSDSPYVIVGQTFPHLLFKVGTCHGQWGCAKDSYFILSVMNSEIGNGHLDDVFQWFEYSAKRDGKNLIVLECINDRFYNHLLYKRGFEPLDNTQTNCIKIFNQKQYNWLLENGNEVIDKETLIRI